MNGFVWDEKKKMLSGVRDSWPTEARANTQFHSDL